MAIVRIGDSVRLSVQLGADTGLSGNTAQAVVADVLAGHGLALTQYDRAQLGFLGGVITLTVMLRGSDYSSEQDVAGHVAGIIYNELGLSASAPYGISVIRGAAPLPFEIDAGEGSYDPMQIPTINRGVLAVVNVPFTPDQAADDFTGAGTYRPSSFNQLDWMDHLAQQLGMSQSNLQLAGIALLGFLLVASLKGKHSR
jgi:hypothetical protein